jgi:hypothetical protein
MCFPLQYVASLLRGFSRLETEFGLAAGKGETVYNLVTGAATDTAGANITQLLIRLG